ncbi:hypothetical protein O181_123406 [Austropuccinia psidii MF-1]|uniref:Uncharacterized protein n=1 Tax=Austropuccinia psidii MF-1 TaxID=1389203 RepID=A0A9Q3KP61_9BASI|nr:hypothetical protein [Austropuccinia psidii MF-1]
MKNSQHNKSTYLEEISISNEGAIKIMDKHNFHQSESVLPQELIDPSLRFNKAPMTGATHKKQFNNFEKSQISFPSNFENIDPRILMEGISGENKSYSNIEQIDPRLIREELELEKKFKTP